MTTETNCRFVLERINIPDRISLDKLYHTYTCGRAKDNEIVCLSLTVSRHHCIFFHNRDGLYVTDLKSANGLFINGVVQQPLQTIQLHVNDIIGIGCPQLNTYDKSMFAYKLHIITQPRTIDSNDASILSKTVLNIKNVPESYTSNEKFDAAVKRKRERENSDTKEIPNKIPKLEDAKSSLEEESLDVSDIEVIHVSLNSSASKHVNDSCDIVTRNAEFNMLDVNKHTDNDMLKISNSVQDTRQIQSVAKHKEESNKPVNPENVQLLVSSNLNNRGKGKENSVVASKNMERTNKSTAQDVQRSVQKPMVNSHNVGSARSKRKTKNVNTEPEKVSNSCNETCNNLNKSVTSSHDANEPTAESAVAEYVLPLGSKFICNGDAMIKLEDEIQLTDDDEEAILNSATKSSATTISPIKLKMVQQEPKTQFSEVDVVNLSDSECDIFPCSQLFDIGFGMNTSIKPEVKEEPAETDSERFKRLDDEDLVISLTDSEDEDNNWLRRLSRSQTLNDDSENIEIKNEYANSNKDALELGNVDIEEPAYDLNEAVNKMQSDVDTRSKVDKESEKPAQEKDTSKDLRLLRVCLERTEIDSRDEVAKSVECSSNTHKKFFKFSRDKDLSMDRSTETPATPMRKKSLERKVPQIEPSHMPIRRRSSSASKAQQIPPKPAKQRLTSKEKKELKEKSKLEQYEFAKDQVYRRKLHKWAECLPPGKIKTSTPLTKEEKRALADDRKKKLKQIAMEERRLSLENNKEKKRVATKPKAKVSLKTRSDLLVEDTISASKPEVPEKASTSVKSKVVESKKSKNATNKLSMRMQSMTLIDLNKLGKIPKKSSKTPKETVTRPQEIIEDSSLATRMQEATEIGKNRFKIRPKSVAKLSENKDKSPLPCASTGNLQGQMKKKRVSFSAVLQTVRVYEIEETNVLKKLKGKDAPLPPIRASRRVMENEKIHEFLLRIFSWNPVWLEEQERLNSTPPVVNTNELHVMLTHYKSYDEYCSVISPLLLLETWYGVTKEFQNIEQDFRRPTLMCSIVENSIQTNMKAPNVYLTTLMLEVLSTKEDIQRQAHPVYGDLVFFEYVKNHEKGQTFHKVFAYVMDVHQTILTAWTHYNKDLRHYVKNPYVLLTYTMITKPLGPDILVNRVQRLRAVTYLRSTLRMVRALECLPNSPLMTAILSPKIEMYHLPNVSASDVMITRDNLNQKQLEAVHKITNVIVQKQAKLCFIQGPPGTGKSKVIANIVTQVLYGNNRYANSIGPLRILVCAPSNAAIDEITLRLLQIRSNMKNVNYKGFKMVRIGRSDVMHPVVKDISVTELAKREVKRTTANTNNIPLDSVDEEKAFLESKMNALKCEIANTQKMDEIYHRHIRMKLADVTAKYELLKCRRPLNEINSRELAKIQRAAENRVLSHADIITCTLSSCYNNQMESVFVADKRRISVCIVDEATQSCEAESLIPLMLGVSTLVLVGDPNQLPATILSPQAKKLGLDQSIFSRVQNAFEFCPTNPIIMLDTQYRMPHEISSWPNKFFYGGKLKTAIARNETFPFHAYRILNIKTNQNNDNFSNTDEAQFVANMIFSMFSFANLDKWECISVGILTPYNNQKSIIQEKISEKMSLLSESLKKKMKFEVNTVDGFQGQERDVIIMSCVRSQKIGFLSDRQRLCVALTRAKHSLILCGNFNVFMRDPMWNSMLSDAKSRKIHFNVNANANPQEIKVHVVKRFNC
ncbi:putative helicase senataxin [Colletes latitarsis]|uniref:putative helicase senataxin n=1 Tax=Colletes latitarsis TaxID=2605962 RepID=UPI004035A522